MTWGTFWKLQFSCQNLLLWNNFNPFLWFKYFWKHHVKTVFKEFSRICNKVRITDVFWVVQQHFRWEYSATKCFEVNQKSFWWREDVFITKMHWMTQKEFFRLQNERQFHVSFVDDGTWDTLRYLKIPLENCLWQQHSVCFWMSQRPKQRNLKESIEQVDVAIYYQFHVSFWIVLVTM